MSSPLPRLPEQPLGDLPDNPLGAPPHGLPHAPVIGKREPLRLPDFIRQRRGNGKRGGRGRSTKAPLPSLRQISGADRPKPAPVVVKAPVAKTPPAAPAAKQPPPGTRRAQRQAHADKLREFLGTDIADHPYMGNAEIREHAKGSARAHLRGFLAHVHTGASAAAREHKEETQRNNPGYKPRGDNPPPPPPEPGMPPEVKAKRAQQYAQMRDTLDALRQQPGGQP